MVNLALRGGLNEFGHARLAGTLKFFPGFLHERADCDFGAEWFLRGNVMCNVSWGATHGRPQGGKTSICPPLEIGEKNENFLEIMKAVAKLRLIDLILAVTVYLPVLHSHCIRHRLMVL